jgi:phenylacetate-CoA ligase
MQQIVTYLLRRRMRGLPAVPSALAQRLQGVGQSDPYRLVVLQERKLRKTVEYCYRFVPYYHEAMDQLGLKPSDIQSLEDVHKLPITRREQLAATSHAFISTYPGLVPTVAAQTGGTTGRPLQIFLTTDELEFYATGEALTGLVDGFLGPEEIFQTHFTVDEAVESIILTRAAQKAGTLMLTLGTIGTLDDHLESIFRERRIPGKKPKVSTLMISPSHLWALTRRAQELGVDFSESGLERINTGGAMVSEDLKQRVLDTWGIRLREGYGLTETFTCAAGECGHSDRLHFSDVSGYAEVLHPETEELVPPGQPGVLVMTTFYPDRELMPLLRYWTGDMVIMAPDRSCPCGLPTTQFLDIVGRADHMVKVGLQAFYPQEIGDSLLAFPELVLPPRFTLRTEQRQDAQYALLDVEVKDTPSDDEQQQLQQRLTDGIVLSRYYQVKMGAVKLVVSLRPQGSIEHPFAYKHRHLVLAQRESDS